MAPEPPMLDKIHGDRSGESGVKECNRLIASVDLFRLTARPIIRSRDVEFHIQTRANKKIEGEETFFVVVAVEHGSYGRKC
jgi:hypothetical protein